LLQRLVHVDDVHGYRVSTPVTLDGELYGPTDADPFEQVRQVERTSNRHAIGGNNDVT
jgi:hypothetical protein